MNHAGFQKFVTEESDRGAALVIGSFFENLVRELLALYLVDDEKGIREFIGDREGKYLQAPMLPFMWRVKLAYLLGLISKNEFDDLKIVAKIRNKFAHNFKIDSFEHNEVKELCKKFHILQTPETKRLTLDTTRKKFEYVSGILSINLEASSRWAIQNRLTFLQKRAE